jgi:ABC-2 type transport system ATP-binding protein
MTAALSVESVSKGFGHVAAVEDLSFEVEHGAVTGFLGPNGAGKTTTLRMILGLVRPTRGRAVVEGTPYVEIERPAFRVGAVLEANGFHPGRTARNHLRILARPNGIPDSRVDEVLEEVDLVEAARRRVGGFSLGMRQRLGIAGALLGDPSILVLDEPTNGLDPAGVHWLREMLRRRADEGAAVLVSSHLLAELALWADRAVIIRSGRLVADGTVDELTRQRGGAVRVSTPNTQALRHALERHGLTSTVEDKGTVLVQDSTPQQVGEVVVDSGVLVLEMSSVHRGLEDAFLDLTSDERTRS